MRKNQPENRNKRRELNKAKAPVSKAYGNLESAKSSIRNNTIVLLISGIITVLFSLRLLYDVNFNLWKNTEIEFSSYYYVPASHGAMGVSTSSYYVIVDQKNREWHIPWDDSFDSELFEKDVKEGDRLKIRWVLLVCGKTCTIP